MCGYLRRQDPLQIFGYKQERVWKARKHAPEYKRPSGLFGARAGACIRQNTVYEI